MAPNRELLRQEVEDSSLRVRKRIVPKRVKKPLKERHNEKVNKSYSEREGS